MSWLNLKRSIAVLLALLFAVLLGLQINYMAARQHVLWHDPDLRIGGKTDSRPSRSYITVLCKEEQQEGSTETMAECEERTYQKFYGQ